MQQVTDISGLTKERYRDVVPRLIATFEGEYNMMEEKTDLEKAGSRSYVMPKEFQLPGMYRRANWDGGDLGRGNGIKTDRATITPIGCVVAIEASDLSRWETKGDLAVEDPDDRLIAGATRTTHDRLDAEWNTSGDCVLATMSSGVGSGVYTAAGPYGVSLLAKAQEIVFYDSTLTTPRVTASGDPVTITSINRLNDTFVPSEEPLLVTNTDVIVAFGVTGANPTGFFGRRYWFNSTATGLQANLSKVTYPELITPEVTLGGALTPAHFRLAKAKMMAVRGMDAVKKGKWQVIWHLAQLHAYEQIGIQISNLPRGGDATKFESNLAIETSSVAGFSHFENEHCNPTRIDIQDWRNVFRVTTRKIDLYSNKEGQQYFQIYGTSGGAASAQVCYIGGLLQFGVDDPARHVFISDLEVPSGYRQP